MKIISLLLVFGIHEFPIYFVIVVIIPTQKRTYIENIITLYYFILYILEEGMDFYGNNLYNFIYLILLYLDNGPPTEQIINDAITYFSQNLHTIEPFSQIRQKYSEVFGIEKALSFSKFCNKNKPITFSERFPVIQQMNQEINQSLNNVNSNGSTTELSKNK